MRLSPHLHGQHAGMARNVQINVNSKHSMTSASGETHMPFYGQKNETCRTFERERWIVNVLKNTKGNEQKVQNEKEKMLTNYVGVNVQHRARM